ECLDARLIKIHLLQPFFHKLRPATHADLHIAKTSRRGAVSRAHNLHRLALTTIGRSPHRPLGRPTDGVARTPELRSNTRIGSVFEETSKLAIFNLIRHLYTELEVEAAIINAPAFINAHIQAIVGISNQVVKLPGARLKAHIGHPNHWQTIPPISPHTAVAAHPYQGSGVTRHKISYKKSVADNRRALRWHPFIVPTESAQRAGNSGIGCYIHNF